MKITSIVLLLSVTAALSLHAQEHTASKAAVAVDEKLGQYLPQEMRFLDENGKPVDLRGIIDRPAIIAPVYLGCMHACPMLLTGLAQVLGRLEMMQPGRDFRVITLSFDEHDKPAVAREKKKNYLKAVGRPFPENAWMFLTGDGDTIKRFTDSIGFRFQRDGEHEFSHPVVLVVAAPGGKIVRYIEGVSFLPFEITMALVEASEGKVSSPARKALMYCFSYDPLKKSYVFNVLRVTGTVMILFVAGFFAYLMATGRKKRNK